MDGVLSVPLVQKLVGVGRERGFGLKGGKSAYGGIARRARNKVFFLSALSEQIQKRLKIFAPRDSVKRKAFFRAFVIAYSYVAFKGGGIVFFLLWNRVYPVGAAFYRNMPLRKFRIVYNIAYHAFKFYGSKTRDF